MTTIDITNLNLEPAPRWMDDDYNGQVTNIFTGEMTGFGDHGDFVLDYSLDQHHALILLCIDGTWYDSRTTQDWPAFDEHFGRTEWQKFLADFEKECQDELEDDEDDE